MTNIMEPTTTTKTAFTGMPQGAFDLLEELAQDNTSDWMRAHRLRVLSDLRSPFIHFLEDTARRLQEDGIQLEGGEATCFRMQRDLRFTADRRPYHEHIEAVFSRGGQRIGTRASIHVRLGREGSFLRAGSFLQPAATLRALRESMVARDERFLELARDMAQHDCGLTSKRVLKRSPRGFENAGTEELMDLLRLVDPVAERLLPLDLWRGEGIVEAVQDFAQATRKWRLFIEEAVDHLGPQSQD